MNKTFSKKVLKFYSGLESPDKLPSDVVVLNPYQDLQTRKIVEAFMHKFFNDDGKRVLILGINPGRFGGGATGINFTDPINLEGSCGIVNALSKKPETSSTFIYKVIRAFGGPDLFYKRFFLTAASPLGLTKNGKNYNYYDDHKTLKAMEPFIASSLRAHLEFGASREKAIILGAGKNFQFLSGLNEKHGFFRELHPLEHPRFIMQYRSKQMDQYVRKYLNSLNK